MKRHVKDKKIFDMVEKELHSINKVKDISGSIKKFNKVKHSVRQGKPESPDMPIGQLMQIKDFLPPLHG